MKKLLLGLALGAMLFATGCQENKGAEPVQQEPEIAVLNMGIIFQTSKVSQAAMEYMGKVEQEIQAELAKISSEQPQPQANPEGTPQEQTPEMQKIYAEFQQRYNAEQQMVLTRLNTLVMGVIDEYRAAHKLDIILRSDQVAAFDSAVDITESIVTLVNAKDISFEPMLPETPAANATAPAPAGNGTAPAANATVPAN